MCAWACVRACLCVHVRLCVPVIWFMYNMDLMKSECYHTLFLTGNDASYRCFTIRHNTYYYISNSVSYFKYALVKVTIASAVLIV